MRVCAAASSFFLLAACAIALAASCGSSTTQSAFDAGGNGDGTAGNDAPVTPTCAAGQIACGGVCVDPQSDVKNCGGCGNACIGGQSTKCCSGVCDLDTATCSFSLAGVQPNQGPINGGDYITLKGNGFAPGMHVQIGDGVAPIRAIDAHTAIVQTPPGAVGFTDITILNGQLFSTITKAYLYVTGGVVPPIVEKPMSSGVVRGEDPGLAVMQDGRVLIVGGTTVPDDATKTMNTAEIFTLATQATTAAKNTMSVTRWHSSAVTLLTKKVLVVGGAGASTAADLFDPSTDTFAPTAKPLNTARGYTRSVLMVDGRVMIASSGLQTAEIYDPDQDSFTEIPTNAIHTFGFMVRLRDGRVMLGGGDGGQTAVEIYEPGQAKFVSKAPLNFGRSMLTAHTLPDGRVIVLGGSSVSAGGVTVPLDSIETYDVATDKWTVAPYKLNAAPAPNTGRTWHASALVRDGTILVMGGYNVNGSCSPINTVDQIDPVKNTSTAFGLLPHPNTEWTAVTLLDGSVLGVGGGACGTPTALPSLDFLLGGPIQR